MNTTRIKATAYHEAGHAVVAFLLEDGALFKRKAGLHLKMQAPIDVGACFQWRVPRCRRLNSARTKL